MDTICKKSRTGFRFSLSAMLLIIMFTACGSIVPQSTRTASAPTSSVITRNIPAPVTQKIKAQVPSGHNVNMTIADRVMYVGTNDQEVYALQAATGSLLWRTKIKGAVGELPLVSNGVVYVSSFVGQNGPGYLTALRTSDGTVLWQYNSNSYIFKPIADHDLIYVAAQTDGVTALHANNGTQLWHVTGTINQLKFTSNGVLYASMDPGNRPSGMYALRASDGSVLWSYATSNGQINTFALYNEDVYVFTQDKLSVLQTQDGHQLWSRIVDGTLYQPPQFSNGVIYLMATKILLGTSTAGNAGILYQIMAASGLLASNRSAKIAQKVIALKEGKTSVYALRVSDGTLLWQKLLNQGQDSFASWFTIEQGVVYTSAVTTINNGATGNNSNKGIITALRDRDGGILWQDWVTGTPQGTLLANGVLYTTIDNEGNSAVYSLQTKDGAPIWGYSIDGDVFNGPDHLGATIYSGGSNGIVYALRAADGGMVWHYSTDIGS